MILVPSAGPGDWKRLLADPEKHWRDGYSAKSAAESWERGGLPPEVAALFPPGAELLLAIPEYPVAMPGRGAESMNDIFALVRAAGALHTLMVEAKVNESFDRTLAEWNPGAGANKALRFGGICGVLGLDPSAVDPGLHYQLFHRTASAVLTAEAFCTGDAAMIVQSFSPEDRWLTEFQAFVRLFGDPPGVGEAMVTQLPSGIRLRLGWAQSTR